MFFMFYFSVQEQKLEVTVERLQEVVPADSTWI